MTSNLVKVLGVIAIIFMAYLDAWHHDHFSDSRIDDDVNRSLMAAGYNQSEDSPINVTVNDGVVTLTGKVSADKHQMMPAAIGPVTGMRKLVNNLLLASCDEDVIKNLQQLVAGLDNEAQLSYLVQGDCMITLTGWVPTQSLKDGLGGTVSAIGGVGGVDNQLEVGKPKRKLEDILVEILNVQNIYFDFNLATIRAESLPSLDRIAEVLKENSDKSITIEGHTDDVGSENYNQKLSEARANAVRDALLKRGVPASQVQAIGFGESRPIAPNTSPETRAENRRIEFKVG